MKHHNTLSMFMIQMLIAMCLDGCGSPSSKLMLQPTSTPQIVTVNASKISLKVGDTVTITTTINAEPVGGFGQPYYTMRFKDDGMSQPTPPMSILSSGKLKYSVDTSNVLKFVSIDDQTGDIVAVFQAIRQGRTQVSAGIYGEVGETDGSGHWWWTWMYKTSSDLAVTVIEP